MKIIWFNEKEIDCTKETFLIKHFIIYFPEALLQSIILSQNRSIHNDIFIKRPFHVLIGGMLPRKPKRDRLHNKKTKKNNNTREQKKYKIEYRAIHQKVPVIILLWHVNERYCKQDNVIVWRLGAWEFLLFWV